MKSRPLGTQKTYIPQFINQLSACLGGALFRSGQCGRHIQSQVLPTCLLPRRGHTPHGNLARGRYVRQMSRNNSPPKSIAAYPRIVCRTRKDKGSAIAAAVARSQNFSRPSQRQPTPRPVRSRSERASAVPERGGRDAKRSPRSGVLALLLRPVARTVSTAGGVTVWLTTGRNPTGSPAPLA